MRIERNARQRFVTAHTRTRRLPGQPNPPCLPLSSSPYIACAAPGTGSEGGESQKGHAPRSQKIVRSVLLPAYVIASYSSYSYDRPQPKMLDSDDTRFVLLTCTLPRLLLQLSSKTATTTAFCCSYEWIRISIGNLVLRARFKASRSSRPSRICTSACVFIYNIIYLRVCTRTCVVVTFW